MGLTPRVFLVPRAPQLIRKWYQVDRQYCQWSKMPEHSKLGREILGSD